MLFHAMQELRKSRSPLWYNDRSETPYFWKQLRC